MTGTLPGAGNLEEVTRRVGDDVDTAEVVILRESTKSSADVHVARLTDTGQLAVWWSAPLVVAGEVVTHQPRRSPLDADKDGRHPSALRGGVVNDPDEVDRIRARVEYGELPMWRRATTTPPEGWR